MRIWGKVFGFLLGFMAGNIFGALFGLWLGHKFDIGIGIDFNSYNKENEEQRQRAFFESTFSVMGHITKASGRVSEDEISFALQSMKKWGLNQEMTTLAKTAFSLGKRADFDLNHQLKLLKRSCLGRFDLMQVFIEIQIQAAFADGDLHPKERKILHIIARHLGLSIHELDMLLDRIVAGEQFNQQGHSFSPQQAKQHLANAYKVLGVSEQMDAKEIKKAYRKLMSQHHPDKLVAKGLPPELMEAAKQKAQDIQAAYELITQQK